LKTTESLEKEMKSRCWQISSLLRIFKKSSRTMKMLFKIEDKPEEITTDKHNSHKKILKEAEIKLFNRTNH